MLAPSKGFLEAISNASQNVNTNKSDIQTNVAGHVGSGYDPGIVTPGLDINEYRANHQPVLDKAANGLIKMGALAGTTYVGGVVGLPFGIATALIKATGTAANGGEFFNRDDWASTYDNTVTNTLDSFNKTVEEKFPHYYTKGEQEADAFSSKNIFTTNFLFDKLVKNAGFTIGALKSAQTYARGFQALGKIMAAGAYGAEKVAEVEALAAQGMKYPAALEKVAKSLKVNDAVSGQLGTLAAAAGEAQFEALEAYKSGFEGLMSDFEKKNGRKPIPMEVEELKSKAHAMGNADAGANMLILYLSDAVQFGGSLTKGFKTDVNALRNTVMREGVEEAVKPSTWKKALGRTQRFGKGAVTEGWEEGSQTFSQKAVTEYYNRKDDLNAKADVDAMIRASMKGTAELFGTKEGLESMLLGALTGVGFHAGQSAISGQFGSEWNKEDREYQKSQDVLDKMSAWSKQSLFSKKMENATRFVSLRSDMVQAAKTGNVYDYMNLRHDALMSGVQLYSDNGRLPVLLNKIDEEAAQVKNSDEATDEEKTSAVTYAENLKKEVKRLAQRWDEVNTRFPEATDGEKQQLFAALAGSENRFNRESDLSKAFAQGGLVMDAEMITANQDENAAQESFVKKATEALSKNAAAFTTTKEDGTTVTAGLQEVEDYVQLGQDRKELASLYGRMAKGDKTAFAQPKEEVVDDSLSSIPSQSTDSDEIDDDDDDEAGLEAPRSTQANARKSTGGANKSVRERIGEAKYNELKEILRKSGTISYTQYAKAGVSEKEYDEIQDNLIEDISNENADSTLSDEDKSVKDKLAKIASLTIGNEQKKLSEDEFEEGLALLEQGEPESQVKHQELFKNLLNEQYKKKPSQYISIVRGMYDSRGDKEEDETKARLAKKPRNIFEKVLFDLFKDDVKYQEDVRLTRVAYSILLKTLEDITAHPTETSKVALENENMQQRIANAFERFEKYKDELDGDKLTANIKAAYQKALTATENFKETQTLSQVKDAEVTGSPYFPLAIDYLDKYGNIDPNAGIDERFYNKLFDVSDVTSLGYKVSQQEAVVVFEDTPNNFIKEQYNVLINGKKVGYLKHFDEEFLKKNPQNIAAMETNRIIKAAAKKDGQVKITVKFNFGINTGPKGNKVKELTALTDIKFDSFQNDIESIIKPYAGGLIIRHSQLQTTDIDAGGKGTYEIAVGKTVPVGSRVAAPKDHDGTDAFLIQVERPDGNATWLGVTPLPLQVTEQRNPIAELSAFLESDPSFEQLKEYYLKNVWFAGNTGAAVTKDNLANYPYHLKLTRHNKGIFLEIRTNNTPITVKVNANDKIVGRIYIGTSEEGGKFKPFSTQEEFVKNCTLKLEAIRVASHITGKDDPNTITAADFFAPNPLRVQPRELKDFGIRIKDGQLWKPRLVANGIISAEASAVVNPTSGDINSNTGEPKAEVTPTTTVNKVVQPPVIIAQEPVTNQEPVVAPAPTSRNRKQVRETAKQAVAQNTDVKNVFDEVAENNKPEPTFEVVKTNFEKVRERLAKILPRSIKVNNIEEILHRLSSTGTTWGAYSKAVVYLADNIEKGTEYHEAFHTVFRALMTKEEKDKTFSAAFSQLRLGIEDINNFKASNPAFANATTYDVLNRIIEEYLANRFQRFMNKAEDGGWFRQLFNKIVAWLRFHTGNLSELDTLFYNIQQGNYKSRTVQEYGGDEIVEKRIGELDSITSSNLVNMVLINYMDRRGNAGYANMSESDVIKQLAKDVANSTEFVRPWTEREKAFYTRAQTNGQDANEVFEDYLAGIDLEIKEVDANGTVYLRPYFVSDDDLLNDVAHEVEAQLRSLGISPKPKKIWYKINQAGQVINNTAPVEQKNEDKLPEMTDAGIVSEEDNRIVDILFDQNLFATNTFANVSEEIKRFLYLIGNRTPKGLIKPINAVGMFARLQRALADLESYEQMLEEVTVQAEGDEEMAVVLEAMNGRESDDNFKYQFRAAFQLSYADSLVVQAKLDADVDTSNMTPEELEYYNFQQTFTTTKNKVISANRNDVGVIQAERFKRNLDALRTSVSADEIRQRAINAGMELDNLAIIVDAEVLKADNEKVLPETMTLLTALKSVGIDLKPATLRVAVNKSIHRKAEDLSYSFRTKKQQNNFKPQDLEGDLKEILNFIATNRNPYESQEENKENADTALSRVKRVGLLDANYRSDIYMTTFKNPEGELVSSFCKQNYELVRANQIRMGVDAEGNDLLANEIVHQDSLDYNYLYKEMKKAGKSGIDIRLASNGGIFVNNGDGKSFKHLDSKSKLLADLLAYNEGHFTSQVFAEKSTSFTGKYGKEPIVTVDMQTGKSASFALDAMADFAKADAKRILREIENIEKIQREIAALDENEFTEGRERTIRNMLRGLKKGYHFERYENGIPVLPDLADVTSLPRAFRLTIYPLLDNAMIQQLQEGKTLRDIANSVIDGTWEATLQYDKTSKVRNMRDMMEFNVQLMMKMQSRLFDENRLLFEGKGENKKTWREHYKKLSTRSYDRIGGYETWLRDYVTGSFILNTSYSSLIRGDLANYENQVDATKRAAALIAAGTSLGDVDHKAAIISDMYAWRNNDTGELRYEYGLSSDDIKGLAKAGWEHVNTTDAQSYMDPQRWLEVMKRLGKFDAKTEYIATKYVNGEQLTVNEQRHFMKYSSGISLKMVYYDGQIYIKTSIVPLFKQLTMKDGVVIPGREALDELRLQMAAIGGPKEVYHESAIKLGKRDVHFTNKNGSYSFTEDSGFTLNGKHWRLQVENPSGKLHITFGTQLIQLIDSEASDTYQDTDGQFKEVLVEYQGQQIPLKSLRENYEKQLKRLTTEEYNRVKTAIQKSVELPGGGKKNIMTELLRQKAEASGESDSTLAYYDQTLTGEREFGYNMSHRVDVDQMQLMTNLANTVFSRSIAGLKLTLVASSMFQFMDKEGVVRRLKIHRLKGGELQYAECILSEELLINKGLTRKEFEALSEEKQQEVLTMLGFRIPTQSHHSMIPFKVVDWVPAEYGSIVIAPAEITFLAGSDYDIDALFVIRKEFNVIKNADGTKDISVHRVHRASDNPANPLEPISNAERFDQYFEDIQDNDKVKAAVKLIYEKMKAIDANATRKDALVVALQQLNLPATFEQWMSNPIESVSAMNNDVLDTMFAFLTNEQIEESMGTPSSMDAIKDAAKVVMGLYDKSEESILPYTAAAVQHGHWLNNFIGKANVGIIASISKAMAALAKYNIQLKNPITFMGMDYLGFGEHREQDFNLDVEKDGKRVPITAKDIEGITDLKQLGEFARRKGDTVSSVVSAMTDNAKERLAAKLNLTTETLKVYGAMLALGVGLNRASVFVNQPVVIEYAKWKIASNAAVDPERQGKGTVLSAFIDHLTEIVGPVEEEEAELHFDEVDLLKVMNPTSLERFKSFKDSQDFSSLTDEDREFFKLQLKVMLSYQKFDKVASEIFAFNRLLNINKDGLGSTTEDMDNLSDTVEDLIKSKYIEAFGLTTSGNYVFLGPESTGDALNKIGDFNEVLKNLFLNRVPKFMNLVKRLKKAGMSKGKKKVEAFRELRRGFVTEISMQLFKKMLKFEAIPGIKGEIEEFQNLLYSNIQDETIVGYYNDVIDLTKKEDADPRLANNTFLLALKTSKKNNARGRDISTLELDTFTSLDPKYKEKLMDDYEELFRSSNSKVLKFARMSLMYLVMKDGLQFRKGSFASLLPTNGNGILRVLAKGLTRTQKLLANANTSKEWNDTFTKAVGKSYSYIQTEVLLKWLKPRNMLFTKIGSEVKVTDISNPLVALPDGTKRSAIPSNYYSDRSELAFRENRADRIIEYRPLGDDGQFYIDDLQAFGFKKTTDGGIIFPPVIYSLKKPDYNNPWDSGSSQYYKYVRVSYTTGKEDNGSTKRAIFVNENGVRIEQGVPTAKYIKVVENVTSTIVSPYAMPSWYRQKLAKKKVAGTSNSANPSPNAAPIQPLASATVQGASPVAPTQGTVPSSNRVAEPEVEDDDNIITSNDQEVTPDTSEDEDNGWITIMNTDEASDIELTPEQEGKLMELLQSGASLEEVEEYMKACKKANA